MTKAEKLARELAALAARYTDADFERAEEILTSGDLFQSVIRAAKRLPRGAGQRRRAVPLRERIDDMDSIRSLVSALPENEREELLKFSNRLIGRRILTTTSATRSFAQLAGVDLPKKLPPRGQIAKRLAARLQEAPPHLRSQLIEAANRMGTESSLRLWSNLIVKNDEPDR